MSTHVSVDDKLKQIITPNGKSYYQVQQQRTRLTAIILGMSTLVSLVFLVFAFIQKAAADQAREMAVKNEVIVSQLKAELEKCQGTNTP
ncbi:MAG TPA: hypothetical protein VGD40_20410 [Chryseosolibacter sp.]